MYKRPSDPKVLNVSEARAALPRLVQQVARGGRPVAVGRRGNPEVIMMSKADYDALTSPEPLAPDALYLEVLDGDDALDQHIQGLRSTAQASLAKRAKKLTRSSTS